MSALRLFNAEGEETQFSWNLNNEKVFRGAETPYYVRTAATSETLLTKIFSSESFNKSQIHFLHILPPFPLLEWKSHKILITVRDEVLVAMIALLSSST